MQHREDKRKIQKDVQRKEIERDTFRMDKRKNDGVGREVAKNTTGGIESHRKNERRKGKKAEEIEGTEENETNGQGKGERLESFSENIEGRERNT